MDKDFAVSALYDNELWENIRHHREVFTSVKGIDYNSEIRTELVLTPPQEFIENWKSDYVAMQQQMVYGESLPFDTLIERMHKLEDDFSRMHSKKV